jgi:demethylmenaquinone methyltransferase/2-methoxy-6-polyprenyl-1,4-benzoquinol methylase
MPVDKSASRVRRMFGEIAGRYDFLNHLLSLNIDRYWRWRTVRKVPADGSAPILDICSGTGDLALAYERAGRGQTRIIGADFCHEMLVRAADKSRRRGADGHVCFVEADALNLPFPDNSFQIVCVAFGLRNVSDTDGGLREMARVCQPGGRVAVLEFSMPRWQPFRAIYGWYFRRVLPRIGQFLARNRSDAYNYLPTSVGEFPEREALVARMEAAGLTDVRYHSLTFGVATLYVGRKE